MATMLSTNDLAAMVAAQTAALPSTCTIQRLGNVPDGAGGWTSTAATLASSVPCRLAPVANPTEQVVADQYAGRMLWQLTLPQGTDITHADKVVIDGLTYEVAGIQSGGAWETARRVLLVRTD